MDNNLLKPTPFKVIFALLGTIAEFYGLFSCYIMDGSGCPKFFYYISRPFFIPLERIGDISVFLMFITGLAIFTAIFYTIGIGLEFIYKTQKVKS